MRRSIWGALCIFVALFGSVPLHAQEIQYAVSTSVLIERLDTAERRIAELEGQRQTGLDPGYEGKELACDGASSDCCCEGKGGWIVGAELLFLKPYASAYPFGGSNDHQPASRLWLGGQLAGGLGGRFRWFEYNQSTPWSSDDLTQPFGNQLFHNNLRIRSFDLEATDSFQLTQNWRALSSFGVRYTDFNLSLGSGFAGFPAFSLDSYRVRFAGTGPTLGLQLNRDLNWQNLSLFVSGQQSLLFGTQVGGPDRFTVYSSDQMLSVSELQLGLEWNRPIGASNALLFARAVCEAQYYYGVEHFNAATGNVGLTGGGLTLGIRR